MERSGGYCGEYSDNDEKIGRARQDDLREGYSVLEANVNAHLATAIGDEIDVQLKSYIDTSA